MYEILVNKFGLLLVITENLLARKWGRAIGKGAKALTQEESKGDISVMEMILAMILTWGGLFLLIYVISLISGHLKKGGQNKP